MNGFIITSVLPERKLVLIGQKSIDCRENKKYKWTNSKREDLNEYMNSILKKCFIQFL